MKETPISPQSQQQIADTARSLRNIAWTATVLLALSVAVLYLSWQRRFIDFIFRRGDMVEIPFLHWSLYIVSFLYLVLLLILIHSASARFKHYLQTEAAHDLEEALASELLLWRFFLPFLILLAATIVIYMVSK